MTNLFHEHLSKTFGKVQIDLTPIHPPSYRHEPSVKFEMDLEVGSKKQLDPPLYRPKYPNYVFALIMWCISNYSPSQTTLCLEIVRVRSYLG